MAATSLVQQLEKLLTQGEPATSDSAHLTLSAETLDLEVAGVGRIDLPVGPTSARALTAVAGSAHFGRGEETLHDASVRDTWELTPDQVTLGDGWQAALRGALERLGSDLGITDPSRLRAELHAMLVYGKGQFFAPHQDSEKHDEMVATLVLTLPSNHSGGELVVHGRGAKKHYAASRQDLSLVAFYADRRHEVLPVRSGHRVCLTFNLLLEPAPDRHTPEQVEQVAELLRAHFSTPVKATYATGGEVPLRLALLLDHEYSQAGLTAGRLKGRDARRASLLMAAAEAADCEWALAQAQIQETWDVQATDDDYSYRDFDWDDEGAQDEGRDELPEDGDGELGELIDHSSILTWWADAQATGEITLPLDPTEVCAPTPSRDMVPCASEHEGYMGTYGNTEDRWYRRAALVLWPRSRSFRARAEASPDWALRTVRASLADDEMDSAGEQVRELLEVWGRPPASAFSPALAVAVGIDDADLARELLSRFELELLGAEHADALARLANRRGKSWWATLGQHWGVQRGAGATDRASWVEGSLAPLCGALRVGGAGDLAGQVASWMVEWLANRSESIAASTRVRLREQDLWELGPALSVLLTVADDVAGNSLVERVRAQGDVVLPMLVSAIHSHEPPASAAWVALADHVGDRLRDRLAAPPRDAGDWSIAWTSPGGEDPDRLAAFLASPTERRLEWPLAKPRRAAIHAFIDEADLPVRHVTRRTGRPYALVLEKTDQLFAREKRALARAVEDLARAEVVIKGWDSASPEIVGHEGDV